MQGSQRPRVEHLPAGTVSTLGPAVAELAAIGGIVLDPWQRHVLDVAMGERDDDRWSAFRVGLVVPRQNGKTATLLARMLASLFLLDEQVTVFSAHQFRTTRRTFNDLVRVVRSTPAFWKRVGESGITSGAGNEAVRTKNGNEIAFVARSRGAGRGFTVDGAMLLDEAFDLPDELLNAMLPTMAAKPRAQVWLSSSAVNQTEHPNGVTLARVRERALQGGDDRLAYFEWSVDEDVYRADPEAVAGDPVQWATANPALGRRIDVSFMGDELQALSPQGFAVEHLGVGDWPVTDGDRGEDRPIPQSLWSAAVDVTSRPDGPVLFAVDTSRVAGGERPWSSVCAVGRRPDGRVHVELVDRRQGVDWLVPRLVDLTADHDPQAVVLDSRSPTVSHVPDLSSAGLPLRVLSAGDVIAACGRWHELLHADGLRHRDQDELNVSVAVARRRNASGAWVYDRPAGVDSSPLLAAVLGVGVFASPDGGATGDQLVGQVF